jgi:hypothetical protein
VLNFRLDVYLHQSGESEILDNLRRIRRDLDILIKQGDDMAGELERLSTEVTEIGTVVDSAIGLINGLAQQIRDLATDPAALNALADSLDSKANELAAAVVANTPTP